MVQSISVTATTHDAAFLDLPWSLPLSEWSDQHIASLPKGISRHLVRFVNVNGSILAIKETTPEMAQREYDMLRIMLRADIPCVEPAAVINDRFDHQGNPLNAALATHHLKFSLPYRALFSQTLRPKTATRLVKALSVLLARLHITGFFWGDVSLSNTLFRRDAGEFAAYLVDAETTKYYPGGLSTGQRENDLEIARVNVAGELMDLAAGGKIDEEVDPIALSADVVASYRSLWAELTESESFASSEKWRINERVKRLNDLGFDIDEFLISTSKQGTIVRIQPKVVDAGHHQRRLLRLTGLDVGENQARRLLNDLDSYGASSTRKNTDEGSIAHEWLTQIFEPIINAVPAQLKGKLEPAELFHQLLEHRWYMCQKDQKNVSLAEALTSYIEDILRHRRDEDTVIAPPTDTFTLPVNIQPEEDWRKYV